MITTTITTTTITTRPTRTPITLSGRKASARNERTAL